MKELRREHHRRNQRFQDSGGAIVVGVDEQFVSLLAGLGDYALWQWEPRFTACMRDRAEAVKNFEALEAYGFGRDLCNAMRMQLGGLLRGHLDEALQGRKPSFVLQFAVCPFYVKTAQFAADLLGVPAIGLDNTARYRPGPIEVEYLVEQMEEVIERMEQATGRPYDDERFLAAVRNEWESAVLWAEICALTKHIPAPLDYRHLQSLRIPQILDRDKAEVAAFYRELHDEVQERVAQGISARGFEDARLLHEGFLPWHSVSMLRWPEHYGAIFIGGAFAFSAFGAWAMNEEGRWVGPAKRWWERGFPLRTREDGLRAVVDLYMGNETERRQSPSVLFIRTRPAEILWRVKDWQAQAVVMGMERRCRPDYVCQVEQMLVLQEHGIPAVEFDPSSADPREFDEAQAYSRVSALLEGMGLRKMEVAAGDPQDDD